MEIYFDNAATTKVDPQVAELMQKVFLEDYGNPSSKHKKGIESEQYIRNSRQIFAKLLKVEPKEIYFTSGGTESNNLAIIGTALANKRKGNHIITTSIEHASVLQPMQFLEEMGFRVTYLPVNEHGVVDLKALEEAICEDTILVSVMGVNNEVGALEPIEEIARVIKKTGRDIYFHVDAIQMFGKYRIYPKRLGIDLLSVSGHKIYGPKGSGILFIKDRTKIKPVIYGGGQQNGMRSGTENTPAIAGIGLAAEKIYENLDETIAKMSEVKDYFISEVTKIDGVKSNSQDAPHIASITFKGVRSEVLLHALEDKGIFVSSGSACSSNRPELSGTLLSMGLTKEDAESTLRFSFSKDNTKEEVAETIEVLKEQLLILRKFTRR